MTVERNGYQWCQGAILAENWIVTSPECNFKDVALVDDFKVRAGTDLSEGLRGKGGTLHQVHKIVPHEKWDNILRVHRNYLTLLQVREPFKFDDTHQPIELFKTEERLPPGRMANLTGFGWVRGPRMPKNLQWIQIPIIEFSKCYKAFESLMIRSRVPEGFICAGYYDYKGGRNACVGDKGAPLVVNRRLVGFAFDVPNDCETSKNPVMFTEIAYHREWIDQHVKTFDLFTFVGNIFHSI